MISFSPEFKTPKNLVFAIHIRVNSVFFTFFLRFSSVSMVDGWCQLARECFPQHSQKVISSSSKVGTF